MEPQPPRALCFLSGASGMLALGVFWLLQAALIHVCSAPCSGPAPPREVFRGRVEQARMGKSGGGQIQPPSLAVLLDAWVKASEGRRGCFGNTTLSIASAKPLVGENPEYLEGPCEHLQKALSTAGKRRPSLLGAVS